MIVAIIVGTPIIRTERPPCCPVLETRLVSYSDEDEALRRIIQLASLTALFLIVGCDPGMTIREAVKRDRLNPSSFVTANPNDVIISVKTGHPLIGETWYDPTVTVTNLSPSQVTISAVELVAAGIVHENKGFTAFPLVVLSGKTVNLDVRFALHENVWKTFFKRAADLRLSYSSDGQQRTAHATIIGDHLNSNVR